MVRSRFRNLASSAREPFIVCLLGLPATSPLWKSSLPRSFDGLFHLYRLLELDHLLRQGLLFSPWAPDLFFGYGYPIFSFVPPLPYYLSEAFHLMGLSLVHTLLFSFSLALLASGVTMFLFVKDLFGPKAGLVSAVAYMYAPFHLYDILFRGHLPGAWATALYPLVLWAFHRLIAKGGLSYLVASALLFCASFLTHNPATLIFIPFLVIYVIVLVLTRKEDRIAAGSRVATAIIVGAGLASFFWIPALWDRQWVQLDRMITPPDLDFHTHFISPAELLAVSPVADAGLMNPGLLNNIGPVHVALSLFSVLGLWRFRRPEELLHLGVAMLTLSIVVFMVMPHSAFVWENLPFLNYLVYPHRFLRLGSLLVAILCGAAARLFTGDRRRLPASLPVTSIAIAMIILSTFSLLYPPYYRDLPLDPSFVHMMEFERRTGTKGTTSFGEYLPVWAEWMPTGSPLEDMYRSEAVIERLDKTSLPHGAVIMDAQYAPTSMVMHLNSPASFQATFNSFYFPGWRAYIDGHKTAITPTHGQGLISVSVPAGQHSLELRFEDMPVRGLFKLTTTVSSILLVLVGVSLVMRPPRLGMLTSAFRGRDTPDGRVVDTRGMSNWQASVLAIVAILLLVLKTGYVDRHETWFRRDFDGIHVPGVERPLMVHFGDQFALLGYDLAPSKPQPGDTMSLTLYWTASGTPTIDYSAFAHVVDDVMNIYAQEDSLNPGRYPTRYWEPDEYNKDSHEIVIPPGTPPGDYELGIGLYDPAALTRLPISEGGRDQGGMLFLQELTVLKSDSPPDVEALGIQNRTAAEFTNGMTLLGYSAERVHLNPGDFYRLALFWKAKKRPAEDYSVSLRFLNRAGEVSLYHTSQPSAGRYPSRGWQPGEIVRDNHTIRIRADFPAGNYAVQLAVLSPLGDAVPIEGAGDPRVSEEVWLELATMQVGE